MLHVKENQDIEFKQSWRDEYIKWICGFANAKGGTIYIGVDDNGVIVGISDAKKLLEEIPNKVRDILGIIIDVRMKKEDTKEYLEMIIEPYPSPVSYKGQYHYRTGSSKLELKGAALDRFLLQKQGKKWDGVPLLHVSTDALDASSYAQFIKKALDSKRLDENALPKDFDDLLDKLMLRENEHLKRAAILLFHKEPQRFFTGAYIKIAYFQSNADIIYQDVIEGNLFVQVEKTFDLLLTKYLKALISYEGLQRIERYAYDVGALREVLLNAVVHKDYESGIPIQIGVYEDKLFIFNAGHLPENWTVETLTHNHRSIPFNPDIANVFFRAGLIESWGRGIEKIIYASQTYNQTTPIFTYDNGLNVTFPARYLHETVGETSGKRRENVGKTSGKILALVKENAWITIPELAEAIGVSERSIERTMRKLQDERLLIRKGAAKGGSWEVVS